MRIARFALAAVATALSAYAYAAYIHMLGFPDGHVSALASAQRSLAYAFIAVSMAVALYAFALALAARPVRHPKRAAALLALYPLLAVGAYCVDRFYLVATMTRIG